MYTLNSSSVRCPPKYQEHQASLGSEGRNVGGGGDEILPVAHPAHGEDSNSNRSMPRQVLDGVHSDTPAPRSDSSIGLSASVADVVPNCVRSGESFMPMHAPCPIGMDLYGATRLPGTVQELPMETELNTHQLQLMMHSKMSSQHQRMQEEITREKLRLQHEIARQNAIIQQYQQRQVMHLERNEGQHSHHYYHHHQQQQQRQRESSETPLVQLPTTPWQHMMQQGIGTSLQPEWLAQQIPPPPPKQSQPAQPQLQHRLHPSLQQGVHTSALHLSQKQGDNRGVLQRLAQHQQMAEDKWVEHGSQRPKRGKLTEGRKPVGEAANCPKKSTASAVVKNVEVKASKASFRDEEEIQRFKNLYALQSEEDGRTENLREQAKTAIGVLGTLDADRCMELIKTNDVTIVVTDTGTGKSTLIPKAILDDNPNAKVANAQPRRIPAIKLAQRVAALYGENVGKKVGYWVRGEHVGTLGETPIMYVTNYTLFLHMLHYQPDTIGITHIIFDEFHERTVEVEVLLLMMKLVMQHNPGKLRLILCSATVEVSKWVCFFENLTVAEYSKANAMYPIHDYYLEDVCKLTGLSFVPSAMGHTSLVQSVQLHTIILHIKEMLKFLAATAAPQHSILIFVPGRTVVEQLSMWIRNNLGDQLDPIPWYRDIELSFIQEALQRESVMKKKVYVATDIAEVSLTLPDVVFVIDSGTAKRPHITDTNLNSVAFPPLELLWESSVNLIQRRGRIGRVQQGFFFTMLSKEHTQHLSPSVSRLGNSVLHEIVLHCLHLTSSPFLMFSLCREEPRRVSVQLSLSTLCDGGYIVPAVDSCSSIERVDDVAHLRAKESWGLLITKAYEEKYRDDAAPHSPLTQLCFNVTLRGLIVGALPFDVASGTIVFHGLVTGLTTLAIILASCVSCNSPFHVPYGVTDALQRTKLLNHVEGLMRGFKGEFQNDALAGAGAIIAYMAMQREGLSEEGQNAWCEERHLSRTRITDTLLVVKQTREQLAAILPFEDVNDVDELMEQYDEHALPLSLICSAAHMHHAIYVLYDADVAQRKRYAGSGVFIDINCCRDKSVPTTCPWQCDTICIPFTLQTIYGRLVGSFSSQLRPGVFNIMLLLFSSRITYEEIQKDAGSVTFEVTQCGSRVYINCDNITALQLLQLRRLMCAKLCVLHFVMRCNASAKDEEAIAEHLRETGSDFGIPPNLEQHPHLLGGMITSSMTKLVHRIEAAEVGVREIGSKKSSPEKGVQPFCRATARPAQFRPVRQSALVFANNGCVPYDCSANVTTPIQCASLEEPCA